VADIEPGELLRNREVAAARRRLLATGVFSKVQVDTVPQPAGDGAVPTEVIFDLEEHPRYSIAAGLRWVSGEGVGAVVDLLDRNVLGRGATLGLRTRYSDSDRSVRLYSVVHRLLASPNDLELFTQRRERTSGTEAIDTFDLSFQFSRQLGERWRRRFYGRFREVWTRPLEGGERVREESPLVGMQFIYGEQQVAELEPKGEFFSVDLSGALADWGGKQDVLRLFTQLNTYRGFEVLGQRFTWGQSVRLGWAQTFDDELLRRDLRFRAGGELSVRGYRTDTLGPLPDEEGAEAPGGAGLLVINQELRFPLRADLQGLVFFDLGNVWEDPEDLGSDLRQSLGLGVRAATPIGLLRLDLAWPLDRREQDEALKIYIGFGNIF
jgi:translocation and assembly module TamA